MKLLEIKIQYHTDGERELLMEEYEKDGMILVEEQNLFDGNFLIFAYEPRPIPLIKVEVAQEEFESLKSENTLLKAQNQALADRAEFHEDVLTEIILTIHS